MAFTRRRFTAATLIGSTVLGGVASVGGVARAGTATDASRAPAPAATPPFMHGVASGDPLSDRVILWTRVTSNDESAPVPVRWRIARDEALRDIVNQGEASALPSRDGTVKVDALGLAPGRTYYYQFEAQGHPSPIGRTRTLPSGAVDNVRLAVVSCANYAVGWFNAYAAIGARADLDAVVHLGDYIYESAAVAVDGVNNVRAHLPAHELISLTDYRTRHAQYKTDPDLQEAHRQHPWIVVWDDHESANDSWTDGAKNHNPEQGEGDWATRKAAATRAYAEWLPVREVPDDDAGLRLFRHFAYGDLLDLIMLDTRLYGRNKQVDKGDRTAAMAPSRTLLGNDQAEWLAQQLRRSQTRGAKFRVIGQQVMFAQLLDAQRAPVNMDQWDGYAASRARIFDQLASEKIDDVIVLSGDIHSSWAFDLARDPYAPPSSPERRSLAVEMVTTSVTSHGIYNDSVATVVREQLLQSILPHLRFTNLRKRGYLLLDVTPERAQGEWYLYDSVLSRSERGKLAAVYATQRGANRLVRAAQASARMQPTHEQVRESVHV